MGHYAKERANRARAPITTEAADVGIETAVLQHTLQPTHDLVISYPVGATAMRREWAPGTSSPRLTATVAVDIDVDVDVVVSPWPAEGKSSSHFRSSRSSWK